MYVILDLADRGGSKKTNSRALMIPDRLRFEVRNNTNEDMQTSSLRHYLFFHLCILLATLALSGLIINTENYGLH